MLALLRYGSYAIIHFDNLINKEDMHGKIWSDRTILKSFPNPIREAYEIKHKCEGELTFLGVLNQPDFADIYLTLYPAEKIIELKSLKLYFQQFRAKVIPYERLINIIYDDVMAVYQPIRLRIVMKTNARGGIQSRLTIDSDWSVRGGKEIFKDWFGQSDEW